MTQTKYPELMAAIEAYSEKQKHFIVAMREKVYPVYTIEEKEKLLKEKKEKLKETNTDVYSRFLAKDEPDWAKLLKWR